MPFANFGNTKNLGLKRIEFEFHLEVKQGGGSEPAAAERCSISLW